MPQGKTGGMPVLSVKSVGFGDGESLVAAKSAAVWFWLCGVFGGGRFQRLLEHSPIPFASRWVDVGVDFTVFTAFVLAVHPAAGCRQ
jgi:hypothetical protein